MLWSLEKKLTVADSGGNIPYVFQEMVTKVIWNVFRQSDLHEIRFHMSAWVVFISEGEGGDRCLGGEGDFLIYKYAMIFLYKMFY